MARGRAPAEAGLPGMGHNRRARQGGVMGKTVISIGPFHPLQEEPELFTLTVEGEKVVGIDLHLGYNHRGIEKLSESKTFDQSTFVIERICGICSTSHPFAYTRAVEDVIGVEEPERARYIRTIIAEGEDRKSTRLNSSHGYISYAVF